MKCSNCGAPVSKSICSFCKSYVISSDEAMKEIKEFEQEIQDILDKIKYFEKSNAPTIIKEKKIKLCVQKLKKIGYDQ